MANRDTPPIGSAFAPPPPPISKQSDQQRLAEKLRQEESGVLPRPNLHSETAKSGPIPDWQPPAIPIGEDADPETRHRRDTIKEMMLHAWNNYVKYAWGENELRPLSKRGHSAGIFGSTRMGRIELIEKRV